MEDDFTGSGPRCLRELARAGMYVYFQNVRLMNSGGLEMGNINTERNRATFKGTTETLDMFMLKNLIQKQVRLWKIGTCNGNERNQKNCSFG